MTTEELIETIRELLDTELDSCIADRIQDEPATLGVEIEGRVWFLTLTEA